ALTGTGPQQMQDHRVTRASGNRADQDGARRLGVAVRELHSCTGYGRPEGITDLRSPALCLIGAPAAECHEGADAAQPPARPGAERLAVRQRADGVENGTSAIWIAVVEVHLRELEAGDDLGVQERLGEALEQRAQLIARLVALAEL